MEMTVKAGAIVALLIAAIAALMLSAALGSGSLRAPSHQSNGGGSAGWAGADQVPFHVPDKAPRNRMVPYTTGN
jgi:hypothetical protein